MPSIWPLGAPLQAPAGPPVLHAHCLLPRAGSALAWLPVRSWRGLGAPRAALGGLAEWALGPAEHWGPPGAWLGGVAPGSRGPGPRAGSSAMVSRLHSEETDLCMEKGRGSVGERERGLCRGWPGASCPQDARIQAPPRAYSCPHVPLPPAHPLVLLLLGKELGSMPIGRGLPRPGQQGTWGPGPVTWHSAALSS